MAFDFNDIEDNKNNISDNLMSNILVCNEYPKRLRLKTLTGIDYIKHSWPLSFYDKNLGTYFNYVDFEEYDLNNNDWIKCKYKYINNQFICDNELIPNFIIKSIAKKLYNHVYDNLPHCHRILSCEDICIFISKDYGLFLINIRSNPFSFLYDKVTRYIVITKTLNKNILCFTGYVDYLKNNKKIKRK